MTARRTAVVTGGLGGIGRATVAAFDAAGWETVSIDLRPAPDDHSSAFIQADLRRSGGLDRVVAELAGLTRVDALVNNAAVQVNAPLVNTSDDEWNDVIETNVGVVFRLMRALHPQLARSRGAVVNVASVHAVATSLNVAAYAASKGALVALTRSAALEFASDGIRCNAVLPGAVETPMLREGLARRPHDDGHSGALDELVSRTPLGFVATPEQIAPSIVFLADGDASPYTTGQILIVDGGALAHLSTE